MDVQKAWSILEDYEREKFSVAPQFEAPSEDAVADGVQSVQVFTELKSKLRSTRMIHQFLTHIEKLNVSKSMYSELFPTQSEYADVELEMAKTKNGLGSIKRSQTEQQKRVKNCAKQNASEFSRLQVESEKLQRLLRKKLVVDQLACIRAARGNDDAIETLATDSSLTTAAARALNDMLASDKYEMRNTISSAGPRCNQLRAQLEHAQQRRSNLGTERDALALQESTLEDADPCTKELKRITERNRVRELVANKVTGCSLEFALNNDLKVVLCARFRGEEFRITDVSTADLAGIRILDLVK